MTHATSARESRRRRLLVVDDDRDNIELVIRTFRERYEVHSAMDGQEGLQLARRVEPHVIVADQRLPNLSGVELLAIAEQELPRTVRVLVSGYTDFKPAMDAVNVAHVHHYAEKPVHPITLATTIDGLVRARELESERDQHWGQISRTVRDLDHANQMLAESEGHLQKLVVERTMQLTRVNGDLDRANELVQQLAVRDGLTGLFNHRYLIEHLTLEIARAQRYARTFGMVLVDIDNFTRLNHNFGATAADKVLVKVAQIVQGGGVSLRRSDFAVRYGSDAFCVLLPETDRVGTLTKAERIRQGVEATDWDRIVPRLDEAVTVTIGVAIFPEHGTEPQDLIAALNAALAGAQNEGSNHVLCAAANSTTRHAQTSV
jgi:diguanylate cyclase (GGDEF)-like protein